MASPFGASGPVLPQMTGAYTIGRDGSRQQRGRGEQQ